MDNSDFKIGKKAFLLQELADQHRSDESDPVALVVTPIHTNIGASLFKYFPNNQELTFDFDEVFNWTMESYNPPVEDIIYRIFNFFWQWGKTYALMLLNSSKWFTIGSLFFLMFLPLAIAFMALGVVIYVTMLPFFIGKSIALFFFKQSVARESKRVIKVVEELCAQRYAL